MLSRLMLRLAVQPAHRGGPLQPQRWAARNQICTFRMRQPRTLGEWIFFLALASMLVALGVLFFLYPPQPIPEQRSSYIEHSGLLEAVVARQSGRRLSLVRFRIINDPTVYECRFPRIHEISVGWRNRETTMRFFTLSGSSAAGSERDAQPVYGLVAGGISTRSLEADIRHTNSLVSPWAGVVPLGVGGFGFLVAGLVWRRRSAA